MSPLSSIGNFASLSSKEVPTQVGASETEVGKLTKWKGSFGNLNLYIVERQICYVLLGNLGEILLENINYYRLF